MYKRQVLVSCRRYKVSVIAKQVSCARTKTEDIVTSVWSPHSIDATVKELSGISYFGVATDGSNHGSLKLFPVLLQYFDLTSGGIKTKVVELKSLPNEKSETTASYVHNTLKKLGIDKNVLLFRETIPTQILEVLVLVVRLIGQCFLSLKK